MKIEKKSITTLVDEGLLLNTSGTALATKRNGTWIETSIEDFRTRVRHFALGLNQLGVSRGDKVALHSENSTEWMIVDQALLAIGAVSVPVYTTQPGDQISYILNDAGAVYYIYSNDSLFSSFKPHIDKVDSLRGTICLITTEYKNALGLDELYAMGREREEKEPELFQRLKNEVDPDDLASLIYTSGTTGNPKGVMLTHFNISSNVQSSKERTPFDPDQHRHHKILSYLPLSHVYERMINYLYIYMGLPVYYIEKLEEIPDDFQTIKPIYFATVPRLLEKIHAGFHKKAGETGGFKGRLLAWALNLADNYNLDESPAGLYKLKLKIADKLVYSKLRDFLGGNLIGIQSGGAALAPNLMNFFNAIGIYCNQGYGLTETSPVITVTMPGMIKSGSSGKAITGVEIRIADDGEILARGPNIMKGYYNNPEATREVLTEDGWFHTGDIGRIDEDGYIFITDRKKSMFKLSTGKYVSPQHVENTLLNSRYIEQVVVLGAHRKFCSALIVPNIDTVRKYFVENELTFNENDPDFERNVEAIVQQEVDKMNEILPKWEQIKRFALLDTLLSIESGELTPTMKTKRNVVHEKFRDKIETIYSKTDQDKD
ncbi:MAG: AMP-dependent synthetase/ligase [Cyclonatronaceae bacterium]